MFKKENGDWKKYRELPNSIEIDFHFEQSYGRKNEWKEPYCNRMYEIYEKALEALKKAYEEQRDYVIFTHGHSTSRRGKTTARSQIRSLMRSKESTPYIIKNESIQHYSVFVAAIRKK